MLCSFYCHLEFWLVHSLERGVPLPSITPRERQLPLEEQWHEAIAERDRLTAIWREESIRRGLIFDFPSSSSSGDGSPQDSEY